MQRSLAALAGLVVLVAACTTTPPDASPSPTPTAASSSTVPDLDPTTPTPGRVAVVIAPEPPLAAAAAEIGVRGAVSRMLGDVELRVATADSATFVADLAGFFTSEGYDLVCVVGAGAEAAVRQLAATSPSTRFCAAPASADGMPDNVLAIDLRVEELGYLAGVALAEEGMSGPAGLVTSRVTWAPDRLEAGLVAGLAAGGVESPTVRTVGPIDDEEMVEQVTALLEEGFEGILSFTGTLDATVVTVVDEVPVVVPEPSPPPTEDPTGAEGTDPPSPQPTESEPSFAGLVAGPEARPTEDGAATSEQLLAILELHLEEAVALAVSRHVEGWDTTPASVGLADGAFRVDVGDGSRGRTVADALAGVQEALRAGELDIPIE